ncbi:uncharacterized protein LOC133293789 [Gastrolobium bilobum]|uniref:uncharacterized protein LOC133293789 n=1 Tax=Gastrolobium bilobum TaxID=150636 RepID=UPI002AB0E9F8|nr:uncharacterized protein LOC133293789 [Gastrolobium bilobum]
MLDWLLKPKFYTKCNSCVKLIKLRLEFLLNKRNAVLKFLKKDIADLLSSGLDYKAYERAGALLIEQNKLSCYELVANFVGCIFDHLEDFYKQRDCPDDCKEAIPSLMYAAARFSDLPELRELRTLFSKKFGNSLESCISKELRFVEKLRSDPPSKELSIQLLHDLAQEFSIEWHSKTLEQRFFSQLLPEPKHDPLNDYDDAKGHKNNNFAIPRIEDLVTRGEERDKRDHPTSKGYERYILSKERSWRLQSSSGDETTTEYSTQGGSKARSSSLESVSEDELEIKESFSIKLVPPSYVQEKFNKGENNFKKTTESEALTEEESNHDLREPVVQRNQIPRSVRQRHLKPPPGNDNVSDSKIGITIAKLDSSGMKSEKAKEEGDSRDSEERMIDDELLMHCGKKQHDVVLGKNHGILSGIGKANTSADPSQQGHHNRQKRRHAKSDFGATSLPAEETVSKQALKGKSDFGATSLPPEETKGLAKSDFGATSLPPEETVSKQALKGHAKSDFGATSLPPEETVSKQTSKGHARAISLEPQMLRDPAHVHPRLPDYDELHARFTAQRKIAPPP